MYQIRWCGLTDVGLVREHNEDVWKVVPEKEFFLLADGMGGHSAGEIAAFEAVDNLSAIVGRNGPINSPEEAEKFFYEAFLETNQFVFEKSCEHPSFDGMGTTLCSIYFFQGNAILAHVGDSRIYQSRRGRLQQLTEDHTLLTEFLALGALKPEDSASFPYKHILTRAIGTHPTVEPSVQAVKIEIGDLFLLCSDGLTNFVNDATINSILKMDIPLEKKAQFLIDEAKMRGGGDNITVLLLEILGI